MKRWTKIGLFGILTWLVPFVTGFFFYTPEGGLLIGEIFFKTIMILVGSVVGAVLIVIIFKEIESEYLKNGITIGIAWLLINWILDFVILLPMAEMNISTYFMEIGLRYLTIPVTSTAIGYLLEKKIES
ncbi:MAG: hypothetical protein ACE5J5_01500 [Candidatus Hydrothermarchaeales archaeon]